jgi:hypothetical protein
MPRNLQFTAIIQSLTAGPIRPNRLPRQEKIDALIGGVEVKSLVKVQGGKESHVSGRDKALEPRVECVPQLTTNI